MNVYTAQHAEKYRKQFPSLLRKENGRPVIFFDGPGGTQVPVTVVDAISEYMLGCNANHGGIFQTSVQSERWIDKAHQACADFLNASDPNEIVFGQNMTSLTFAFSRALSKTWQPGDEIIVTRLDHDANISPWVRAAEDSGVTVHRIDFNHEDFTLELEQLQNLLSKKTKLVAVGCASNATGGINPVKQIAQWAHEKDALVYLDAVHYAPHGLIDVQQWECDFLACSAYKFFGPHTGILWGRKELLESIDAYAVRPADNKVPGKWMTGTQSHESIVGVLACIDYIEEIGQEISGNENATRRESLTAAYEAINHYEQELSRRLITGLHKIPGIKIYGITDLDRLDQRFPTISITHQHISTPDLAKHLAKVGIYVWHGNYYALEFTENLDLEPEGMIRIGLVHYNTPTEIDRLLQSIGNLVTAKT